MSVHIPIFTELWTYFEKGHNCHLAEFEREGKATTLPLALW
jgi:hypothetical protein